MALWKGIQAMNKRTLNDFSCNFKHVFVWAMLTLQYTAGVFDSFLDSGLHIHTCTNFAN